MQSFVHAYENAEHWSTRRQILSILFADFPTKVIRKYFPTLSKWKVDTARAQAHFHGNEQSLQIICSGCILLQTVEL